AASPATSWGEPDNEALVLEVSGSTRGFIGHLVLHQGAEPFAYTMALGALAAGEGVAVKVSSLSASKATKEACALPAPLGGAASLGGEGLANAPVLIWPKEKRFDDLPVVLGWSESQKHYQLVYTNEN